MTFVRSLLIMVRATDCWRKGKSLLDLRKFALRLKVIEILDRYQRARRRMHIVQRWKRALIHPN